MPTKMMKKKTRNVCFSLRGDGRVERATITLLGYDAVDYHQRVRMMCTEGVFTPQNGLLRFYPPHSILFAEIDNEMGEVEVPEYEGH